MHIYLLEFILNGNTNASLCKYMHTIAVADADAVAVAVATATLRYCDRIKMNIFYIVLNCLHTYSNSNSNSIYWGNLLSNLLPFSSVKVIQAVPYHFRLIIERLRNTSWAFACPSYRNFNGKAHRLRSNAVDCCD